MMARPRELALPADHEREPVEWFRDLRLVTQLRGHRKSFLTQLLRTVEVAQAVRQLAASAQHPGPQERVFPT